MTIPRLNRLFAADGKCFDVAVDHGYFNERNFLGGIEAMPSVLDVLVAAAPDAVQLTRGQAAGYQARTGPKPALVLRTDVANVYGSSLPDLLFSEVPPGIVEHAVTIDAACVVVNLLLLPGQPALHRACVANVMQLRDACDRTGMPLMVEPLVMQPNEVAGGYMVDGDIDKILPLVRQAVELGADVIKADPTDDPGEYHRVIEIAGTTPVLVRGGGKVPTEEILDRTRGLMAQGAAGIVYGRNIIQHPDPEGVTRALMAIVHDGADVATAITLVAET